MIKYRTRKIIHSGLRAMSRAKLRTFFMMLSIIIGIKALTLTITIGKGIEKKIMDNVGRFMKPNNIIVVSEKPDAKGIRESESGPVTTFKIDDVEAIADQLDYITTYDYLQVVPEKEVSYSGANYFATIKGCRPVGEEIWGPTVERGQFFDEFDLKESKRVAIIGPKIVKELFKSEDPLDKQFKVGNIPFRVIGVSKPLGADPHGNDLDDDVYIPITTLMRRVANVDYILSAKFELENSDQIDEAQLAIADILRQRHSLTENEANDFNILSPIQVKQIVAKMVRLFSVLLPSIAAIALIAGALVIIVLMNISVNQRTKEIGLRKAIGAKDKDIMTQFIAETTAIVVIGGIIGLTLGLVASKLICSKLSAVFYVPVQAIIIGTVVPILIGLISGILPARRAAKLDPVDSIK